jgi:hypothetical protein
MKRIRRFPAFAVWLACLAVLTAVNRCTFKKPVTPSWDVRFELPLIDTTYTMQKLADENPEQLSTDPSRQEIILNVDKGPETFYAGKYLTAKSVLNSNQYDSIGIGTIGNVRTISDALVMENTILVDSAEFNGGRVEFRFNNTTGYKMRFEAWTPSLLRNNMVYHHYFDPVPTGTSLQYIDLAGLRFKPIVTPDKKNRVPYTGTMSIDGGSSNGNNIVNVEVELQGVSYDSVTGWLNRTEVLIDSTVETGIKVSDMFKGIEIESAILQMTLDNEIRFPADFDLTLTGIAEDGRSETVQIPPQSVGANQSIVTNSVDFARIANLLPRTLRLQGTAFIGKGFDGSPATIRKDDKVEATIHFEAPLIFTLPPAMNTSNVDTIKIKEDARGKIRKNVLDAKLVFEIDNAVPLGAAVSFCFGDTLLSSINDTLFYTYADLIKTISLDSARTRIDPANPNVRIVSQASPNTVSIGLSKAELKIFEFPEVFWQCRITFLGTNGMVKIRPEDYIHVRARIEALINTEALINVNMD